MYFLTFRRVSAEDREYMVYGMRYNDELFAEDISTDENSVSNLVDRCNRHSLHPIHMFDVIEDFLAE